MLLYIFLYKNYQTIFVVYGSFIKIDKYVRRISMMKKANVGQFA